MGKKLAMTATSPPTSPTASPAEKPSRPSAGRPWIEIASGVFVIVAVLALVALHLSAMNAYRASFDVKKALDERAAAALLAHQLEPWNGQSATRAIVMRKWQHAAVYLSQGAYLPAMQEYADAYRLDVGDKELLAQFQISQDLLTLHSNFKAHIQHAHEGPGGSLRPQDLLP